MNKSKSIKLKHYTHKDHIKTWLTDIYTFTDKKTFISYVQLVDEFEQYMDKNKIQSLEYELNDYNEFISFYTKLFKNLKKSLKELEWPCEEGYLSYEESPLNYIAKDQYKIQGFFYLLKKKDIKKKYIEVAPENNMLTDDNRIDYPPSLEFNKRTTCCYIIDFVGIEEKANSKNIDRLIAGSPDSDEFMVECWENYPVIYSYWNNTDIFFK